MKLKRDFLLILGLVFLTSANTYGIYSIHSSPNGCKQDYIEIKNKEEKSPFVANLMHENNGLSAARYTINMQNLDSANRNTEIEIRAKVISEEASSDARDLANNEIEIYFLVNGMIIDTITDFGEGSYDRQGSVFYVASSIAEKSYQVRVIDNNTLSIAKTVFFDGNENVQWVRTYKSNWILTKCDGDCP
jgi:hypothetical protein